MKINIKRILVCLIIFLCIILACESFVQAFEGNINAFDQGKKINEVDSTVKNIGGTVITIIRVAAVGIAIVMLLVISMKYMLSAPGDRADLKKHAVAYVVGATILFGVSGILTILYEISNEIKLN